ncbi:hypothetical protein [Henriciella sp.]|uniref:hypothetical protein n=1 Tax=Henriciella sp. TaxID=1968823 RepID=UPI00261D34EB|nr:hypothetical protein [Henriciella sp.]
MKLIVAYFIFIAALLIGLSVLGGSYAQADTEPKADTLEAMPASSEPVSRAPGTGPINVDSRSI